MRFLNKIVVAFAAATLLIGGTAFAGNQQAGSTFFPLTSPQTYARGDGLFQHRATKIPMLIGNGDGYHAIGPTYRDTFAYGDGLGMTCQMIEPFAYWVTAANTSCVTTCAAESPAGTCIFGTDAGVGKACATATNDDCLCMPTVRYEDCGAAFPLDGSTNYQKGLIYFGHGMKLAYNPIVVQTIAPDMDAASLDIGGDQVADDGLELAGGIYGASGRPFIPGNDPGFQFCVEVTIADVSGTDEFRMGFRRAESFNATFNSYDDYVSVGCISGNFTIETEEAGGGETTTDTTDDCADTVEHALCTKVSDAGVVTYTIDGQAPTITAAITLTLGEPVIPFLHMLQHTDLTGEVDLGLWEVRYQ